MFRVVLCVLLRVFGLILRICVLVHFDLLVFGVFWGFWVLLVCGFAVFDFGFLVLVFLGCLDFGVCWCLRIPMLVGVCVSVYGICLVASGLWG